MTILLSVLPAVLLVAIGLVGLRLARGTRPPVSMDTPAPASPVDELGRVEQAPRFPPEYSVQLLLTKHGRVEHTEHEIALHGQAPPATYRYAGKVYTKKHRHVSKHEHDQIWVYER